MFLRVLQVAPLAALLSAGLAGPTAQATGVPALRSEAAIVLVGEDGRRGGDRASRGHRGDSDGNRGARGDRDDGRRFDRGSDRPFRNRDNRDSWFGFGPAADCEWLRRRATVSGSSYWWGRYRTCVRG
jgi:hypothetical protein